MTRKKWIFLLLLALMIAAGAIVYFSKDLSTPVTYIPREVKIKGVYLADS